MQRPAVLTAAIVLVWLAGCSKKPAEEPKAAAPQSSGITMMGAGAGYVKGVGARDGQYYMSEGMQKEAFGKKKAALRDYDTAIKMDAKNAMAYFQRGTLLASMGRCSSAAKDLRKAASLDKNYKYQIQYYLDSCRPR